MWVKFSLYEKIEPIKNILPLNLPYLCHQAAERNFQVEQTWIAPIILLELCLTMNNLQMKLYIYTEALVIILNIAKLKLPITICIK